MLCGHDGARCYLKVEQYLAGLFNGHVKGLMATGT